MICYNVLHNLLQMKRLVLANELQVSVPRQNLNLDSPSNNPPHILKVVTVDLKSKETIEK